MICFKHGRIMLHGGSCKDCRQNEIVEPDPGRIHVYPNDSKHATTGTKCWCDPILEDHGNGAQVIVHHQYH
jgi:hypothetical protein